ncbi:VOC family protein [Streptomyces sp. MAR25Y5]|uniref:VOC family protein n=1 Tax=Streptomyces sp. MAR25Y5 TaxID=2962028 RepID=UPI0020B7B439|nr:VOC family protein [Streptomyces sp. MAR25Y5]MCP3769186.1 glyoxalase [Streptomyces sp. MAR25Y5]
MLTSLCPVICTSRLEESRAFYTRLFGFEVTHETEWCVGLGRSGPPPRELVLLDHTHPALPETLRRPVRTVRLMLEAEGGRRELERIAACREETGTQGRGSAGAAETAETRGGGLVVTDPNGTTIHVIPSS